MAEESSNRALNQGYPDREIISESFALTDGKSMMQHILHSQLMRTGTYNLGVFYKTERDSMRNCGNIA